MKRSFFAVAAGLLPLALLNTSPSQGTEPANPPYQANQPYPEDTSRYDIRFIYSLPDLTEASEIISWIARLREMDPAISEIVVLIIPWKDPDTNVKDSISYDGKYGDIEEKVTLGKVPQNIILKPGQLLKKEIEKEFLTAFPLIDLIRKNLPDDCTTTIKMVKQAENTLAVHQKISIELKRGKKMESTALAQLPTPAPLKKPNLAGLWENKKELERHFSSPILENKIKVTEDKHEKRMVVTLQFANYNTGFKGTPEIDTFCEKARELVEAVYKQDTSPPLKLEVRFKTFESAGIFDLLSELEYSGEYGKIENYPYFLNEEQKKIDIPEGEITILQQEFLKLYEVKSRLSFLDRLTTIRIESDPEIEEIETTISISIGKK